ncbi:MAG: hypothetical protein JKX72_01750, partial [Robiginitomaculum sp.]|nr:hypothetical protein [Robiginitomaculum sp.]
GLSATVTDLGSQFVTDGIKTVSSAISFEGSASLSLNTDSGDSASDGITNNGEVTVAGLFPGFRWEYSTDNGGNWTSKDANTNTFELEGQVSGGDGVTYATGAVQVRQINPFGARSETISNSSTIVVDKISDPDLMFNAGSGGTVSREALFRGTGAEAGATILLSADDGQGGTIQGGTTNMEPDGSWYNKFWSGLAHGTTYTISAQQTDIAGNVGELLVGPVVTSDEEDRKLLM